MSDFVEIKAIVTKESYNDFFKRMKKESDTNEIFVLLKRFFDVKQVELHGAYFQKYPPQERLTISGNGSMVSEKGFESSKIIKS